MSERHVAPADELLRYYENDDADECIHGIHWAVACEKCYQKAIDAAQRKTWEKMRHKCEDRLAALCCAPMHKSALCAYEHCPLLKGDE